MERSEPSLTFFAACLGVIVAAYVVGLGIRRYRFPEAPARTKVVAKSEEPADERSKDPANKPVIDIVAANAGTIPETPAESQETASAEEEPGRGGATLQVITAPAQAANVSEEERPQAIRKSRPQITRLSELSEEDQAKYNEDMRELMGKSSEMTREEWKKEQAKLYERYGLPTR